MASELPYEVVCLIASHVEKDYQLIGALVCKRWTEPFLNAYWYSFTIHKGIADRICDKAYRYNIYLNNVHRVYELKCFDQLIFDMEYRSKLPQIYLGIRRFVYLEQYEPHSIAEKIDWGTWNFLSHLEIQFLSFKPFVLKDLITSLSESPFLYHLTLIQRLKMKNCASMNDISWVDIESIHLNLRRLEVLHIDFEHIRISNGDMNKIRCVSPAQTVTTLICNSNSVDTHWVFYFALKYPYLHTLELKDYKVNTETHAAYDEATEEENIQLLSTLDQFFPHLKNISQRTRSGPRLHFSTFFKSLRNFGTQVERAKVSVSLHCSKPIGILNSYFNFSSDTLSVLWVDLVYYMYKEPVTTLLPSYPYLAELHIAATCTIEIDVMLDKCPSLRLLDIESAYVYLSNQPDNSHNTHPLQRLELKNIETSTQVFKHISFRCRKFLFMKLIHVKFKASEFTENSEILLDMRYTQLDFLVIRSTKTTHSLIKHYVIKQDNNSDANQLNLTTHEQSMLLNWYYICLTEKEEVDEAEVADKTTRSFAWELGKREVEYAQRFFDDALSPGDDNRQFMKFYQLDNGAMFDRYSPKECWKLDLHSGVFVIQFKSVKNYRLDKEELSRSNCKNTRDYSDCLDT
ncbi:hypothetical protein J3Q64DRAFT_1780359 [Phycomyces blakesleeanus]|uniref:F-box domain-containing protein n=1 Tax=Phycomyces blakesleeanus TaxID=4837 RepID=A0ABR3AHN8_PHYBL